MLDIDETQLLISSVHKISRTRIVLARVDCFWNGGRQFPVKSDWLGGRAVGSESGHVSRIAIAIARWPDRPEDMLSVQSVDCVFSRP